LFVRVWLSRGLFAAAIIALLAMAMGFVIGVAVMARRRR
jgi:uncharacterized membrane protein YqaE (UPF0057 family)